jgi:hypothetical protein
MFPFGAYSAPRYVATRACARYTLHGPLVLGGTAQHHRPPDRRARRQDALHAAPRAGPYAATARRCQRVRRPAAPSPARWRTHRRSATELGSRGRPPLPRPGWLVPRYPHGVGVRVMPGILALPVLPHRRRFRGSGLRVNGRPSRSHATRPQGAPLTRWPRAGQWTAEEDCPVALARGADDPS